MKKARGLATCALRLRRKPRSLESWLCGRTSRCAFFAIHIRRPKPDWGEGLVLAHFDFALARELERRRESGRARAPAHLGSGARLEHEIVESRPIALGAKHTSQRLPRLRERQTSRVLKRTRANAWRWL